MTGKYWVSLSHFLRKLAFFQLWRVFPCLSSNEIKCREVMNPKLVSEKTGVFFQKNFAQQISDPAFSKTTLFILGWAYFPYCSYFKKDGLSNLWSISWPRILHVRNIWKDIVGDFFFFVFFSNFCHFDSKNQTHDLSIEIEVRCPQCILLQNLELFQRKMCYLFVNKSFPLRQLIHHQSGSFFMHQLFHLRVIYICLLEISRNLVNFSGSNSSFWFFVCMN